MTLRSRVLYSRDEELRAVSHVVGPEDRVAVIRDLRAVVDCVTERIGHDGEVAGGVAHRHDLYLPGDAHHAGAVVPHRGDGPRDARAVEQFVPRVVVVVPEVPPDQVVDEAVAVAVHPVGPAGQQVAAVDVAVVVAVVDGGRAGGVEVGESDATIAVDVQVLGSSGKLALVDPDVGVQGGMRVVDARVDHRHDGVARAGLPRPRLRRADGLEAPEFLVREGRVGRTTSLGRVAAAAPRGGRDGERSGAQHRVTEHSRRQISNSSPCTVRRLVSGCLLVV